MEKAGDLDSYKNIEDFKKSKATRKVGEGLVRWGVFAEIVLGFFVASWDGWQTFENSPFNQPISDIAATSVIELKGAELKETDAYLHESPSWYAMLFLRDSNTNSVGLNSGFLVSDGFKKMFAYSTARGNNTLYSLRFHMEDVGMIGGNKKASDIKNVKLLIINAWFLPTNSAITWGRVTLIVNGEIQKSFTIPPQNYLSQSFQGLPGNMIFATNITAANVVPNSKK